MLTYSTFHACLLLRLKAVSTWHSCSSTLKSSNLPLSGFMSLFSEMEVDETKTQWTWEQRRCIMTNITDIKITTTKKQENIRYANKTAWHWWLLKFCYEYRNQWTHRKWSVLCKQIKVCIMLGWEENSAREKTKKLRWHLLVFTMTDMAVFWTMVRILGKAAKQQ